MSPPAGAWPSPIDSSLLSGAAISIAQVITDPRSPDGPLYHLESRPAEKGRVALVDSKANKDLAPQRNVRTRVHEYGGGAATAFSGMIIFSDFGGEVYILENGQERLAVKHDEKHRYADFAFHPTQPHLVACVREDHTRPEPANVVNEVVLLDTKAETASTLVSGADFYSAARWSADGHHLCWISWEHPDMPWTGSELYTAKFDLSKKTVLESSRRKVGGALGGKESVSQPRWSVQGTTLFFLNDRSGYYQLYSIDAAAPPSSPQLVLPKLLKHDTGGPDWLFGQSTYAPLTPTSLVVGTAPGTLSIVDVGTRESETIKLPYRRASDVCAVSPTRVAFVTRSDTKPSELVLMDIKGKGGATFTTIKETTSVEIDAGYLSVAEEIEYPTTGNKGWKAFAWLYPPKNKDHRLAAGEKPPAVMRCHGGPTSAAPPGLDWVIQYWTSRGFAFVDVNYGGSTGFGREFRQRLDGNWGIVDVADTVACAKYLQESGKTDSGKVAIVGGSAGGYTVLAALCAHSEVFGAGGSSYGVSDLRLLAGDTHKLESRYLDGLVGGRVDEIPEVYKDRSPIEHVDQIKSPMIVLQGGQDKVVPPEQAETIVEAIKKRGGKVEYVFFPDEGHGFRQGENIKRAIESQLAFFQDVFRISSAS